MKKWFLSLFVIVTFAAYAWQQKSGGDQAALVTPNPQPPQQSFSNLSTPGASASPPPQSQSTPAATAAPQQAQSGYKNGKFTGNSVDAYYGNVQVQITVSGGKITDVQFLDYPHDRMTSQMINSQAIPYLQQEAIAAQSAQVDIVSGATQTSLAFRQSLQSALDQAH